MGRLIDEDIVIDIINFECGKWTGLSKTIEKEIKALPSAQPSNGACWGCQCEKVEKLQPERERGKWIPISDGYVDIYECNQCGDTEDYERNFCPNCGADMRQMENRNV